MDILQILLNQLGIGSLVGATLFLGVLGGVAGILLFTEKVSGGKLLDTIMELAKTAILAVEKMADNGQFDDLTPEERHSAKKKMALKIIEDGLRAVGVKPTPILMSLAGMAIEALLKQIDK